MRVFILCTGRCSSTTFIKACKHIKNYTSGHESLTKTFGVERFDYPDNHIEADNRLSWHTGILDKKFREDVFYVHLKRDRDKVAKSFFKRYYTPGSIIDAFCEGIHNIPPEKLSEEDLKQACYDYIDTVNTNIELFLKDKNNSMTIILENIKEDFSKFWESIGAKGNLESALKEFDRKHNASSKRRFNYKQRIKLRVVREWRHIKMCLDK